MNYTDKYHLPQWDKSDRILMDDFNQMCRDLEAGLVKNVQDAASDTSAAEERASAAAAKAQSTADSALSKATSAQNIANAAFSPSYMPFLTGTYTGNGSTLELRLGFRPRFVIITCQSANTFADASSGIAAVGLSGNFSSAVQFNEKGMSITAGSGHPSLNRNGGIYSYIAFR